MNRFNKELAKIGWERVSKKYDVFITKKEDRDGYLSINFPASSNYKSLDFCSGSYEKATEKNVKDFIFKICCCNKFKPSNKKWVVPLLMADYFAVNENYEKELYWVKKAMRFNKNLTPNSFSYKIKENL